MVHCECLEQIEGKVEHYQAPSETKLMKNKNKWHNGTERERMEWNRMVVRVKVRVRVRGWALDGDHRV